MADLSKMGSNWTDDELDLIEEEEEEEEPQAEEEEEAGLDVSQHSESAYQA